MVLKGPYYQQGNNYEKRNSEGDVCVGRKSSTDFPLGSEHIFIILTKICI